jgi:hypothetical protein
MIELATKAKTKAQQVREYVAKNPNAKPKQIAEAVGVALQYVYTVMWTAKKKAKVKRALAKKAKWAKLMTTTSSIPLVKDTTTGVTPERIAELTYAVTMAKARARQTQIEMFEPKADPVNHPAHYKVGGIETIDFIEAKKLGYNLGNVVKYITRADHKGNRKQDLEKALWYLNREIQSLS